MDKLDPMVDGSSLDIVADNVGKMRQLFPDVFTEGRVDFDALREVLGDHTDDRQERYSFTWHGKSESRRIAQTPSRGTLRPCPERSVNWDTSPNVFIEGDNLEVLKLLQKSYYGQIKMICIDPPYNTGGEFIYPDRYQDNLDTYLRYTGQVSEEGYKFSANTETSGRYHTNWLNMMQPRLRLARNLLASDGVIFVSIDDTEVANLRKLCDEIFGEENFVANIVWQHSIQPKGYTEKFSVHHNYLLMYRKSDEYVVRPRERTDEDNRAYSNPDADPRGPWRSGDVRNALYRPNLIFDIVTPSGKRISPPENGWRWSRETINRKIESGEIVFSRDESRIVRKIYLADQEGRAPETLWFGKDVGVTRDGASEIKALFDGKAPFDTVKPTRLIQRMADIAGVGPDDICLDFFAGSGTTGDALYRMGRGRFILVQLPEPVDETLPSGKYALELGLNTISDICIERLKRASAAHSGNGFRVLRLDSTNFVEWDPHPEDVQASLLGSVRNVKPGRGAEDILFELLIKYGLDADASIDRRKGSAQDIFVIEGGALMVCLDEAIDESLASDILALVDELEPAVVRVVLLDTAVGGDTAKTNLIQTLAVAGVTDIKAI